MSPEKVERVTTPKISVDNFATSLKEQYPEYKDVDNKQLVDAFAKKYPDWVKDVEGYSAPTAEAPAETLKKKDSTESDFTGVQAGSDLASGEKPKTDYLKIVDENPNELQRLWNRSIAQSEIGKIVSRSEYGGSIDFDELVYYQNVLKENAPKDSDYLYDEDYGTVGNFVLDLVRTIPESLISMFDSMASPEVAAAAGTGAALGSFVPIIGTGVGAAAGAAGASSFMMEYGNTILAKLQEKGVDIYDADALGAAFADADLMSDIKDDAAARGMAVGAFDALSAGIAGKVTKSAVKAGYKAGAAELLEQTAEGTLGGLGEVAGSLAAGDDVELRDVLLEALADPAQGISGRAIKGVLGKKADPEESKVLDAVDKDPETALSKIKISSVFNPEIITVSKDIQNLEEAKSKATTAAEKKVIQQQINGLRKQKTQYLSDVFDEVDNVSAEELKSLEDIVDEITGLKAVLANPSLSEEAKKTLEAKMEERYNAFEARKSEILGAKKDDTKKETGTPSGEQEGETAVQAEPIAEAGETTTEAGGNVQAPKEKVTKKQTKKQTEEKPTVQEQTPTVEEQTTTVEEKTPTVEEKPETVDADEKSKAKIQQESEVQKIIDEVAPRNAYKGIKSPLQRTARGYRTVIEKTDKRSGKTRRFEAEVFVDPKTKKAKHILTEYVDGKEVASQELKDAKSLRDAVNKRMKAGAVVSEQFQRQYDATTKTDESAKRVVDFKEEGKTKAPSTITINEYSFENAKGERVSYVVRVNGTNRQAQLPYATITRPDGKIETFSTKKSLDDRLSPFGRRKNLKIENKYTGVKTEDADAVFKNKPKTLEAAAIGERKAPTKESKKSLKKVKSTRTPLKFWTYAQVPNEKDVMGITDKEGNRRLFQLTIGKNGKYAYYEVVEKTLAGGVKRFDIAEGAKPLDNKREVINSLREEAKALTEETPTEPEPTPPAKAPKPEAKKKAEPKKAVKPPMNAKSKAEMEAAQKRAAELRAMDKEVVMLDNGKEYSIYEDGTILNKDTGVEIKPTSALGKKVLKAKKPTKEKSYSFISPEMLEIANKYNVSEELLQKLEKILSEEVKPNDWIGDSPTYKTLSQQEKNIIWALERLTDIEKTKANVAEIEAAQKELKSKILEIKETGREKSDDLRFSSQGSTIFSQVSIDKPEKLNPRATGPLKRIGDLWTQYQSRRARKAFKKIKTTNASYIKKGDIIRDTSMMDGSAYMYVTAVKPIYYKDKSRRNTVKEYIISGQILLSTGAGGVIAEFGQGLIVSKEYTLRFSLDSKYGDGAYHGTYAGRFAGGDFRNIDVYEIKDKSLLNLDGKKDYETANRENFAEFIAQESTKQAIAESVVGAAPYELLSELSKYTDDSTYFLENNGEYKKTDEKSQVVSEAEGKSPLRDSIEKARNILKTFAPSVSIISHADTKAFNEAMERNSVNGVKSVREGARFIVNKNTGAKEIHINLENANGRTAVHEAFHAFFDEAFGQNPETAKQLAGRLFSALKRGSRQDKQVAARLKEFIKNYDESAQAEEMLSELAGIMSEAEGVLNKSTLRKLADTIKDFLVALAKKLGIDNRFVTYLEFDAKQRMDEQSAVDFMKGFVGAISDSSANPMEMPIVPKLKSQPLNISNLVVEMSELTTDYKKQVGGFEVEFFQNAKIIKKAILNKRITNGHKLSELNGKMFLMHQPDNASVGVVKDAEGNIIAQTLGGFLFPLKFDGAFWASTRSAAEKMVSDMNSMLSIDGKIRMVLTAAPSDKMFSSTVVARNVQSILNSYASKLGWSEKQKLSYQRKRYDIAIRMADKYSTLSKMKESGQKMSSSQTQDLRFLVSHFDAMQNAGLLDVTKKKNGAIVIGKKKFATSEEYDAKFNAVKDADASAFPTRKELSDNTISAFVNSLSASDKATMQTFGFSKRVTKKEVVEAMSEMMSEPFVSKIENGMAYAILETDSAVEAVEMVGDGSHPSYPYQIKLKDASKSVRVKILENPENPFSDSSYYDVSKDNTFEIGKYIKTPEELAKMSEKERKFFEKAYKDLKDIVYPSSGITQMLVKNPTPEQIANLNKNIYEKTAGHKDPNSYRSSREENAKKYKSKIEKITSQERSQIVDEIDGQAIPQREKSNVSLKQEARKGFIPFLSALYKRGQDMGLFYTAEQKEARKMLEAMNSQLSKEFEGVNKIANELNKLLKTEEGLKLVQDYLTSENKSVLASEILKLENGKEILELADAIRNYVDNISEQFLNDPMFDMLAEREFKSVVKVEKGGKVYYNVVNTKNGRTLASELTLKEAEKIANDKGLRDIIKDNLGTYMNTSYRFFNNKKFKITDAARNKAIAGEYELAKQAKLKELVDSGMSEAEAIAQLSKPETITELINAASKSIDDYIAKIEELRSDSKFKYTGLSASGVKIPSTAFQRRKTMPEHIESLLGKEKDPISNFINTAVVMNQIRFKAEMVHKLDQAFGGDFIKDRLTDVEAASKEWKKVDDPYSPINGMYVRAEILEMMQSQPILQSDIALMEGYFKALKLMRKTKVVYNLPTWRKNLTGGWFFITANGIVNPQFLSDLKNRAERTFKGETNAETEAELKLMAKYGLIGTDVNAGLMDINEAALNMISAEDSTRAEEMLNKAWKKAKKIDSKLGEKYASVDDYTKLIIFRHEKKSFAKKLYGVEYDSLSDSQKEKVNEAAAEFVKQNTPTFSRLPRWYKTFAKFPMGDFLGFKLESYRSISANISNAVADLKKAREDKSLSDAQRAEYSAAGRRRLFGSVSTLGARFVIPTILTALLLDNEDDEELSEDVLNVRPEWMEGHSLIVSDIDYDGNVSVYNWSMEDPYGEITDLLMGDISQFGEYIKPNMFLNMAVNLYNGRDAYGRDIYTKADPAATKAWKLFGYTSKSMIIPPSIYSTAKYQENQMLIRDYKYNIGSQFYFFAREFANQTAYHELTGRARKNRLSALDDVKTMYDSVVKVAMSKGNPELLKNANRVLNRFDKIERAYIQAGVVME